MTLDPISASVGSYAAKELIKTSLGKTYDFIVSKYKFHKLEASKAKYIDYCDKLLQIKTLASQERSVHIDDIYVPLTLKGINTLSITVNDATSLDVVGRAVLIKGLAGMGKSTILRKLLSNNAKSQERLPIFYELKNYKGGDIEDSLSLALRNAGISIAKDQIEQILLDSNVKLYLDAFDETSPAYREELVDEILRLINGRNCQVIVTTRPDTEIDSIADIETFNVDVLSQAQIIGIINKTAADAEKAKSLCDALERSPLHKDSESILKSPILVVLFCISYNLGEEIPSTLSQFYANIFDTIFFRHDNLKGKVNRVRHWNDNRRIYKSLFEYLCFISQRSGVSSFSREKLVNFVADSIKYMNEDESLADRVTKELTSITNLIIEDGFNEYRFIHKSIQEFFAAAFLCTLNREKKYGFYKRARVDAAFQSLFSNTLFFLEEIDYYDYIEHYFIPAISELLELNCSLIEENFSPSGNLVENFLDDMLIRAKRVEIYNKKLKSSGIEKELYNPSIANENAASDARVKLFNCAYLLLGLDNKNNNLVDLIAKHGNQIGDGMYIATLRTVLDKRDIPVSKSSDVLLLSVGILFRQKYNTAVNHLNNRNRQLEKQGYLDF